MLYRVGSKLTKLLWKDEETRNRNLTVLKKNWGNVALALFFLWPIFGPLTFAGHLILTVLIAINLTFCLINLKWTQFLEYRTSHGVLVKFYSKRYIPVAEIESKIDEIVSKWDVLLQHDEDALLSRALKATVIYVDPSYYDIPNQYLKIVIRQRHDPDREFEESMHQYIARVVLPKVPMGFRYSIMRRFGIL